MRRYHLIVVDTKTSDNVDRVVFRCRQRASSAAEAIQLLCGNRKDLAELGLEIRCVDADDERPAT